MSAFGMQAAVIDRVTARVLPRIARVLLSQAAGLTMWAEVRESAARRAPVLLMPDQSSKPLPLGQTNESLDGAMDRYARGDDTAFDELYRHGAPRVRGFLLRLGGDRALADDLMQEAFLRVHRARGHFEQGAAALPWIFAIARNVFLDHVRHPRVRRTASESRGDLRGEREGELHEREAPPDTRGDEALVAREMLVIVRDTLARLPVLQREAFVLIRFEGMSVSEAAQVLGATEGAVKIRAFRAYEALRAALAQDDAKAGGAR
jgi:RNA polymerase sigma-70 factor (ECF subfamily)